MTSATYLQRLREIARERGLREAISPAALLDRWTGLVGAAEQGYRWTIDEYRNELSARDLLEALFTDSVLREEPEVQELQKRVADVDGRLRALLQEDAHVGRPEDPWWQRGVLRSAGPDYVEDLERIYGIRVEPA